MSLLLLLNSEERTVLRALDATNPGCGGVEAYKVAQRTPEFMVRGAEGRLPPMGERRVRRLLAALLEQGVVNRRRTYYAGHLFTVTRQGRELLDQMSSAAGER